MNYKIYKLDFSAGVHFGNGFLNDSEWNFKADTLFSAMCIEALKVGKLQELYEAAKSGRLLLSDAFPYIGQEYLLPKPVIHIEPKDAGNSSMKKKIKKIKYVPVSAWKDFLSGAYLESGTPLPASGATAMRTMVNIRSGMEDTLPFHVGTCYFEKGNGLYVITGYEDDAAGDLAENLLDALSYAGIGGKRNSGLGKFTLKPAGNTDALIAMLSAGDEARSMTLSVALPTEEELEDALDGASYLLEKRSGFVLSEETENNVKKKDLYVFSAGSCFKRRFCGDVYNVRNGSGHPVYRYAKPLFVGVDG